MLVVANLGIMQGQSWINIGNHETQYAKYYVGISDITISRNEGINEALLIALEKAGIEKSNVQIESIRGHDVISQTKHRIEKSKRSVYGEAEKTNRGFIGRQSSASISNVHLMEDYYDGEIGYVLIRIPKEGYEMFDFHAWNENQNNKRKWGSFARSMLLPGWGQFKQEKKLRGSLMLTGFLGSGALIGNGLTQYNQAIDNRNSSITAEDKTRFYDESTRHKNLYYVGLGLVGAIYTWSMLDASVFPREWQGYYYRKNKKPITISNSQNKYYRAITFSTGVNIPTQVEINNTFIDTENFTTISSNTISIELYKLIGMNYIPAFYTSFYQSPTNILSISEWGVALQYPTGLKYILGLYPSISMKLGSMSLTQNWDGKKDIINNYDLGYGFFNKDIDEHKFSYNIEGGLHRWFGKIDLFFHLGYQSNVTFNQFEIDVYDGGTNDGGVKTHDPIRILSEDLPYPSITVGGLYFSLGLSYGIDPKVNLNSVSTINNPNQ